MIRNNLSYDEFKIKFIPEIYSAIKDFCKNNNYSFIVKTVNTTTKNKFIDIIYISKNDTVDCSVSLAIKLEKVYEKYKNGISIKPLAEEVKITLIESNKNIPEKLLDFLDFFNAHFK